MGPEQSCEAAPMGAGSTGNGGLPRARAMRGGRGEGLGVASALRTSIPSAKRPTCLVALEMALYG